MKKKVLILTAVLVLVFAFSTITANAEIIDSGTCGADGDNLTWTLDDAGTLVVSGIGDMANFDYAGTPWWENKYTISTIIIENGIESISDYAFYKSNNLENIIMSNSIRSIGLGAFFECNSLKNINIPGSVEKIGEYAFCYCSKLESIEIPDSVTFIDEYAFAYCNSLKNITISENVTVIEDGVFCGCESLISIEIPSGVEYIYPQAFINCVRLEDITIEEKLKKIYDRAFDGCDSLSNVYYNGDMQQWYMVSGRDELSAAKIHFLQETIDDDFPVLTEIIDSGVCGNNLTYKLDASGTFVIEGMGEMYDFEVSPYYVTLPWRNNRKSIKNVIIGNKVKNIGARAFIGCENLVSITIGSGVESIGEYAFYNCNSLLSIVIPDKVTYVGSYAFYDCSSIENVIILGGITNINDFVFYNCISLKNIVVSNRVKRIGDQAFRGCKELKDIFYKETATKWKSITVGRLNDCINSATIYFMKSDVVTEDSDGKIRYYIEGKPQTGWVETPDGFKYYFFKKDGSAAVGKNVKIGSSYYDFTDGGALIKEYTEDGNPVMYRNGFCDFGNFKKYFVNGKEWNGWQVIDGYRYYFSLSNGRMLTGNQQIGSLIYSFDENGRWTGYYYNFEEETSPKSDLTVKDDDGKYRYYENGEAFRGWKVLKGNDGYYKYYFSKGDGGAVTGYNKQVGSQYYDFYPTGTYIKVERDTNGNAVMTDYKLSFEQGAKNGLLLEEDGEWRYFIDGEFQSGWIETESGKYLFRKADGSAITSADHHTEEGYRYGSFNYIFDENGRLLSRALR